MIALVLALTLTAAPPAPQRPGAGLVAPAPDALPTVDASWEHDLSTATGVVALNWPAITFDRARGEAYVVAEGLVRIFNASGMEIHRFGDEGTTGTITRVAVLEDGNIVAITRLADGPALLRLDYRGEPIVRFGITGLPQVFADFQPDQVVARNGKLYFAERSKSRAIVTDPDGAYRQGFRLDDLVLRAIGADGERRSFSGIDGFSVDPAGNMLITMSTMFMAAVVTPSGEVRMFGGRGSVPGRFNNVGGIDADERGNIYVTDRLRAVVSVWSPDLKHLGDFGYRGWGESNLVTPYEIAAGNGRVLVAQAGNRGVKAYHVALVAPPPPPEPAVAPSAARTPPRRSP
jgi:hypothetical protein